MAVQKALSATSVVDAVDICNEFPPSLTYFYSFELVRFHQMKNLFLCSVVLQLLSVALQVLAARKDDPQPANLTIDKVTFK